MSTQKRAIIVDDSILIRKIIRKTLESMNYKVVGEASNGLEAIKKVNDFKSDLLVMDVMMPKMDGLTAVKEIMSGQKPIKTLIVSAYDPKHLDMAYKALEYGAIAFIQKNTNLKLFERDLKEQIRVAEDAKLVKFTKSSSIESKLKSKRKDFPIVKTQHLLIIGASTGGPNIVHDVISSLNKPFPPIIIIQHLPAGFTETFATRMQTKTDFKVVVADDGMAITHNTVYIAPGGKHLVLKLIGTSKVLCETYVGDRVNGVMPSLDPTILSASHIYKEQLTVAIFTGMGNDGLSGVRSAKGSNAFVLTQDEASCIIYGMPKAINDEDLSDHIGPPKSIIKILNQRLSG